MNQAILHRGPDDRGTYYDEYLTLGHVRLSILDLSPAGHQPMFYEANGKKAGIVFNGEIYNYIELRRQLRQKGYTFRSESDTEVILASFLEYGPSCVESFNGMWAFCIYDVSAGQLFFSRDRAGVKPLYYYCRNGMLIFSSELKGILAHSQLRLNTLENIDQEALEFYFALGYIPAPLSIFRHVYKLEARQNILYDLQAGKIIDKWYYYQIPDYEPNFDKRHLIEEGREILFDATRIRMRSDVPVGAFLSGGLDSSAVVGTMKQHTDIHKLHTFSIGFEGKYDETPHVNIVRGHFGTQHHHQYFVQSDFEKLVDLYSQVYDEPFADYSAFPSYEVSQMAKNHVTVALSGDGGDEIFGGYKIYTAGARLDFIKKFPRWLRTLVLSLSLPSRLVNEALKLSLDEPEQFYALLLENERIKPNAFTTWSARKLAYCLTKANHNLSEALRIYDWLFNSLPDHFLTKVDRASMAHALEVRSPFLDYRFLEFAQRIPSQWKQDMHRTKKLMREMFRDLLPEEILQRDKQGFSPPLEKWLGGAAMEKYFTQVLQYVKILHRELYDMLAPVVVDHKREIFFHELYRIRLFIFGKWLEKWLLD